MHRLSLYWLGGWLFDFTKAITILLFLGLISHYFFYTILVVKGNSMEPNFHDGDMLLVNRSAFRNQLPAREEPVALYFPGERDKKFIKRIIGLPGEEVLISQGILSINGKLFDAPYADYSNISPAVNVALGYGEYFVLGDNHLVSSDSRIWGPLPSEYLLGPISYRLGNPGKWKDYIVKLILSYRWSPQSAY